MKSLKYILLCLFTLTLVSCGGQTSDELILKATQLKNNGKNREAIIVLKNAAEDEPNNPEVRFLLASLYYEKGSLELAEKELSLVIANDGDIESAIPLLLSTQLHQGRIQEVSSFYADEFDLTSSSICKVLGYISIAHSKLGKPEEALSYQAESQTDCLELEIASIYSLSNEDLESAKRRAYELYKSNKRNIDVIELAALLNAKGRSFEITNEILRSAIDILPDYNKLPIIYADTLYKSGNLEEAFNIANKYEKKHGLVHHFAHVKSIYYYKNKQYSEAVKYAEHNIDTQDFEVTAKVISGLSYMHLKNYERAYQSLSRVTPYLPASHPAQSALAFTQLQLGYLKSASEAALEIETLNALDIEILATSVYQLSKSGDHSLTQKAISRLAESENKTAQTESHLGALKLSQSDISGLENLKVALELEPNNDNLKLTLANAFIQLKQYDEAQKIADQFISKQNVIGLNIKASINVSQQDFESATQVYEQSLELDPNNSPALLYLSRTAISMGNQPLAGKYIERLADLIPSDINYHNALYIYEKSSGTTLNSLNIASDHVEQFPKNKSYLLNYVRLLVFENRPKEVITTLSEYKNEPWTKNNSFYWLSLTDAYSALKEYSKANQMAKQWTNNIPNDYKAWQRLFDSADYLNTLLQHKEDIDKALDQWPDELSFKIFNIKALLKGQKYKQLDVALDNAPKSLDNDISILTIKLERALSLNKLDSAKTYAYNLYKMILSTKHAGYIYTVLKRQNKSTEVIQFLESHLQRLPNDNMSRFALANELINSNLPKAKIELEIVVTNQPNHFLALNNLAWVHLKLKEPSSALKYSTEAFKIAPTHPSILDTHAWVLFKNGDIDQASVLIEKAKAVSPNDSEVLSHYETIKGL